MFKIFSLAITLTFLALGLLLGVLNPTEVSFDMFVFQVELPLSILMALAIVVGMFVSAFYFYSQILKQKWGYKKLLKENKKLADEVVQLNKKMVELESNQNQKTMSAKDSSGLPIVTQ